MTGGSSKRGIVAGAWNAGFVYTCMRVIYLLGESYKTLGWSMTELVLRAAIFATIVGLIWLKGHEIIRGMT